VSDTAWPDRFETLVRGHLPLLGSERELGPDLNLIDCGLDSLAVVNLLLALEEEFDVSVPDELLTVTTFATPKDLWSVIHSLAAN
jgi:acyl carrier protein